MADDGAALDRRMFVGALLTAFGAALAISPARARRSRRRGREGDSDYDDDYDDNDDDYDHDAARRARASGEIAPLSEILEHVGKIYAGDVVEVELEREGSRWLYEIKLISNTNRYLEIYVDATTKTIIKVEGE